MNYLLNEHLFDHLREKEKFFKMNLLEISHVLRRDVFKKLKEFLLLIFLKLYVSSVHGTEYPSF